MINIKKLNVPKIEAIKKSLLLKVAFKREYSSKIFYWQGQERKAKIYLKKYRLIVENLEKEIKILERKEEIK